MAKQRASPEVTALEALAKALADPGPKPLLGSAKAPGFFKGSGPIVKAAAKLAEDRGWLAPSGDWAGTGKSRKQRYRMTAEGLHAALHHNEVLTLARSLSSALNQQVNQVTALREQFTALLGQMEPLAKAVEHLNRNLKVPNVDDIARKLASAAGGASAAVDRPAEPQSGLPNEVLRLVTDQRQRDRYQPLTLPILYAEIRKRWPALTLGQFHDCLRSLHEQHRIKLKPYTRALATVDDRRNALFIDGEVMYYVELP